MKLQVLLGVYGCTMLLHLQAEEQPPEKPVRQMLEKRLDDKRKDGKRGRDKDGEIHHRPAGHGDMFGMMDKNSDGMISQEELFAAPRMVNMPQKQREKLFARIDSDGDGNLTPEEIRKMRQESHEKQMREIRELDADKSGGLSYEEMSLGKFFGQLPEAKRKQIFARMDTNGDGQITPEDKPKGHRPRLEEREHGERSKDSDVPGEAPSTIE